MNKAAFFVIAILVVGGFVINLAPRKTVTGMSENELARLLPSQVGNFVPLQSYKMPKEVYDTLAPYGIICNVYANRSQSYDVVVIASASAKSFHDPRICFSSQGLDLQNERVINVQTKTHRTVPVTVVETTTKGVTELAAYCYKGPSGMYAAPKRLMNSMFWKEFTTGKPQEGVFYRFISQYPGATAEDLSKFIAAFLDKAAESSKGFL